MKNGQNGCFELKINKSIKKLRRKIFERFFVNVNEKKLSNSYRKDINISIYF